MFQLAKFFVLCFAALRVSALTGGRNSNVGEYPAFVGIVLPFDTQVCGGSIFNRNHVLTVASCMLSNNYMLLAPNQVSIISGANTINFALPRVQVQAIYVHPEFNPFTSANDIAVVRTQTDFNFPQVAAPLVAPVDLSSRIGESLLCFQGFNYFNPLTQLLTRCRAGWLPGTPTATSNRRLQCQSSTETLATVWHPTLAASASP